MAAHQWPRAAGRAPLAARRWPPAARRSPRAANYMSENGEIPLDPRLIMGASRSQRLNQGIG
jgi:hypothetical protein